jgi:peptide deformylase
MSLLKILEFPDPRLRTVADSVIVFDEDLKSQVANMFETMYQAPGIGLAATQVDYHQRLIVIDVSVEKNQPLVLINPEITARSGDQIMEEGCLSVPEIYAEVPRAAEISVKAVDVDGKEFELEAQELLAVCIQHEMDHLNGKLFVDYLSPLKRERIRKALEKQRKARKLEQKKSVSEVSV